MQSLKKLSSEEFELDVNNEIKRRLILYHTLDKDLEFVKIERNLLKKLGPKHFINNYVWTYEPRRRKRKYPLKLFDYQEKYIDFLDETYKLQEEGLVEKSRDMGITWLNIAHSIYYWLFEDEFTALFGSINEKKIDDFSMDSTFGKARFIIENLHYSIRPILRDKIHDKHLQLINPLNGSYLKGESMNVGFGRSGRSSLVHLDEFAHVQHDDAVSSSVSENSNCRIYTSTPYGSDNKFYFLRHETKIRRTSLHWSLHPLKDREWYEKKCMTMEPHQIAQELDLSYEASVEGRYYPRFDRQFHVAKEKIYFNEEYQQYVYWDFGYGGAMALLFIQVAHNGEIQVWCDYEVVNRDVDFCLKISKGERPHEYEILTHRERQYIDHVLSKVPDHHKSNHGGDNSGKAKTANSKRSCKDAIKEAGFEFTSTGKQTYDWRKLCVDNILRLKQNNDKEWYSKLQISPDCERFIECMYNVQSKVTDGALQPQTDKYFHMVSAFEFFAINVFPIKETTGFREVKVR